MSVGPITILIALALAAGAIIWLAYASAKTRTAYLSATADLEAALRTTEFLRVAAAHARDGVLIHDEDMRVVWANAAYFDLMRQPKDKVIGKRPIDFAFAPGTAPPLADLTTLLDEAETNPGNHLTLFKNMRGDGTWFWNQINMGFFRNSAGERLTILVCRDVTPAIEQEEDLIRIRDRLAYEASHDALTGLANRAELMRFTREALREAELGGYNVGLLHLDLDRFKEINDTYGHSAGDHCIIHAATQLRGAVRSSDMVARVGGDEFVVICPRMPDLESVAKLAHDLCGAVARPFAYNDAMLTCRASIGCALAAPAERDPEVPLSQSDFALYEAKRSGRGRVGVYDESLHQRHMRLQRRAADLRESVEMGGLDYMYQPIVDLTTGQISGFETLVRWNHETEGLVSPADFLPLAEEQGLLADLDMASMHAALEMKHKLQNSRFGGLSLSFNASSELLLHPQFINTLVHSTATAGLDRSQITIEVLETTVLSDQRDGASPAGVIRDLRDAGFQVFLDDFGMGYAGLAHLAELDITGIKLDRQLVKRLTTNETSAKIVATITELCRDLGLRMVAEGVEDIATAERLRALGCQYIQGYWLSHPVTAEGAHDYLAVTGGAVSLPRAMPYRRKPNAA